MEGYHFEYNFTISQKMKKVCCICHIEKDISEFSKMSRNKDGHRGQCKSCLKELSSVYYVKNRDDILKRQKLYQSQNKDKKIHYDKVYVERNKEKRHKYSKQYYQNNKDKKNQYERERKERYPVIKVLSSLRRRLIFIVHDMMIKKESHCMDLIGCSIDDFRVHVESQFTEGMNWGNYGVYGWHIDHIIPCAAFDLSDPLELRRCFHYENLRPLWAEENWSKNAKIIA
jgi:hypothetical protein